MKMFLLNRIASSMLIQILLTFSVISVSRSETARQLIKPELKTDYTVNHDYEAPNTSGLSITNKLPEENGVDPVKLRQEMRVKPIKLIRTQHRVYSPGTSAGIPSAFGSNWGDIYIGIAGATRDRVRPEEVDSSLSTGLGLGNANNIFGAELNYNILSIRRFGENASFNVKVHRTIYSSRNTYIAAAVGWNNFARYGRNVYGSSAGYYNNIPLGTLSSVYGLVSSYYIINPDTANPLPINLSLGLGGSPVFSSSGVGIIAGVGIQVHPNIGVSTAWSGKGLNLAASYLPIRTLPLTLNMVYGDIFKNTYSGSVVAFSVGYGFQLGI